MPRHAQHVQVAVADLEYEQHVEPLQGERAVDVEEVHREHAGGLCAQELPPAGVGVPHRRRWDAVALQDAPDGRGADAVAELEQLALDPQIPPARILSRHPHHHGGKGRHQSVAAQTGSGRSTVGARDAGASAGWCPV